MNPFLRRRCLSPLGCTAVALLLTAPVQAAPVAFDVSAASLTAGTGYGTDAGANGENGGKLLGVRFTPLFAAQHFALANVGDRATFDLATVRFHEPDDQQGANRGINKNEVDQLDLVAGIGIASPAPSALTLSGIVTAVTGALDDADVDFSIAWAPAEVDFGGGRYRLSMNTLSFTNTGQQQTLRGTVELLSTTDLRAAAVPEPGSFALAGAALAAFGFVRRRGAAAR